MVDVLGHFAMGFLWAFPAWFRWDGRVSLAFVGFVLSTAMLPDVDLVLRHVFPSVQHHGVTHTVVFVAGVALLGGVVASRALAPLVEYCWIESEGHSISRSQIYRFVAGGLLLGGLSHVFADMLSSPDIGPPVAPFWPVYGDPVAFDVIYYNSPVWNVWLLTMALVAHGVAGYVDVDPMDHAPDRFER